MQVPTPGSDLDALVPLVPRPGFSVTPPAAELPGYDPSQSPLFPGGRRGPEPISARAGLVGLTMPHLAEKPRVIYRVRREGWVARRNAARSRFATISRAEGPSTPRILRHLVERGGQALLARSPRSGDPGRLLMRPSRDLRGRGK